MCNTICTRFLTVMDDCVQCNINCIQLHSTAFNCIQLHSIAFNCIAEYTFSVILILHRCIFLHFTASNMNTNRQGIACSYKYKTGAYNTWYMTCNVFTTIAYNLLKTRLPANAEQRCVCSRDFFGFLVNQLH